MCLCRDVFFINTIHRICLLPVCHSAILQNVKIICGFRKVSGFNVNKKSITIKLSDDYKRYDQFLLLIENNRNLETGDCLGADFWRVRD